MLPKQYREVFLYLIFGGLTTLINFVVYVAASFGIGLSAWLSAGIAWVVAVCFAFVTNKIIVFKSASAGKRGAREFALFVAARVLSGVIATAAMFVFVDRLGFNEIVLFVLVQIFVIIYNYIASKWLIFKNNGT